jgi:hypothetical protein
MLRAFLLLRTFLLTLAGRNGMATNSSFRSSTPLATADGRGLIWWARDLKPSNLEEAAALFRDGVTVRAVAAPAGHRQIERRSASPKGAGGRAS